jgi:hypothetical protein
MMIIHRIKYIILWFKHIKNPVRFQANGVGQERVSLFYKNMASKRYENSLFDTLEQMKVNRVGLEPTTHGLKGSCSTN